MENMEKLLNQDERILGYVTTKSPVFNTGAVIWKMIIPNEEDPERTDLGSCLEDTLHRMIEADFSNEEIFAETGMYQSDYPDEEDISIDLGYYLSGSLLQLIA